jgi:hypothetical protein
MVSGFDSKGALIENWLKNKGTILFLAIWEQINNPDSNSLEFEGIKNEAGRNSFYLSAKKWIQATNTVGLIAKAGRYGGTYAHRDIAFEFIHMELTASERLPKTNTIAIRQMQSLTNSLKGVPVRG